MSAPIVTFALPRSGSTLLMRLFNRCYGVNNLESVRYNGEVDILQHTTGIQQKLTAQDWGGEKTYTALVGDTEFLSHYHRRNTIDTLIYLRDLYKYYCCGENNWGWKLVNYGIYADDRFTNQLRSLIALWPNVKFVFLMRSKEEVVKSMLTTKDFWNGEEKDFQKRITVQTANYNKCQKLFSDRSVGVQYAELLSYETFSTFLGTLGWAIEEWKYDEVMSVKTRDDAGTKTEEIYKARMQ